MIVAIEAMTKNVEYAYKVSPQDNCLVLFKKNVHGARYQKYRRYASPDAAREAILQLQKGNSTKD